MKGHAMIHWTRSLFRFASLAIVATACAGAFARAVRQAHDAGVLSGSKGARAAPGSEIPPELVELEDRIDKLEPGKQVDEYLKLRRAHLKEGGAGRQVALSRLALKLALANARAANPNADRAERLDFCRRAAEIGESYLKQGDPARALAWEKICGGIEPRDQWASVLRNRIHRWFENRVYRRLVARDWPAARDILRSWRSLLGGDHAVNEGIRAYAKARVEDLSDVLRREGAEAALTALGGEQRRHPGLDAWGAMRKKVAESLQQPFDKAIAERSVEEAEKALAAQEKVSKEFGLDAELAPVDENRKSLNGLVKALQPAPLHRPYGHVRSPAFRLDLAGNQGTVEFSDRGESVEEETATLTFALDFRQRGGERRKWFGVSVDGLILSATEGLASAEALVVGVNGLLGMSRERFSAWVGLGAEYVDVGYTGLVVSDEGSGTVFGNVKVGGEHAFAKSGTVYCDLQYGGSDQLSCWLTRLGARYYANPNFAIGLQILATGVKARDNSAGADIEGKTSTLGLSLLVQF